MIRGGGAYGCTLCNCVLSGNTAALGRGGGAYGCTLYHCTLTGNTADNGGGADECTLHNCTLTGNTTESGGAVQGSTLYNCTLIGNSGGGASVSTLYTSTLHDNTGVGASSSTLYQCTVTGNSGGGVSGGKLYNSIVYFNQGPNWSPGDWEPITLESCCTTPLPSGPGNIEADPQFTWGGHISSTSPCLGAGSPAYARGVDMDGEAWANPPAIGADQVWPGPPVGPLTMQLEAEFTEVAAGFPARFRAHNVGPVQDIVWDFGDGIVVTNQVFIQHAWAAPGTYSISLTGYNDGHLEGIATSLQIGVLEAVHYASATNPTPVFPFTSWATAATNIQDAINASRVVGRLVLVTNGVYQAGTVRKGWFDAYRAALTNVVLRSVNGPEVTVIDGTGTTSCVYVGANATLTGFTLRNGWRGVESEPSGVITKCVITGNGDGAYGGTLYNCVLTGNSSIGASSSRLFNCIVYFNGGNWDGCTCEYSCTTPLPPGPGNIEADPRFVNAAAGDFRLRPDSPCIDAGTDLTGFLTTDILGLPRPLDGDGDGVARFDMGAYEFALLTLRFAPDARLGRDGFHFTVLGEPGQPVRVERSRDLRSWETVTTVPALPATGQALLDAGAVGERMLFYRAVREP